MTKQTDDEIVDEIRRVRQAHAESLDYDLTRITRDLQRLEREAGCPVVKLPSRKPEPLPRRTSA
jgi:hypothetical protein